MKKYTIGVDIGGGHILSAAIDTSRNELLAHTKRYAKVDNKGSLDEILTSWSEALNQTIEVVNEEEIAGIGFAMPGAFNYKEGVGKFEKGNKKYLALYDVHITTALKPYLNLEQMVPFRYLNDATSFAVGEAWVGKAKGSSKSIAITLGTGLGSAFIDSGVPVVKREDVPTEGCLWHLPFKEALVDDYFSTRWFTNTFHKRFGQSITGVKELADAAADSAEINKLFIEFGENMGEMFTPWLQKFPAEKIVMGGNISGAFNLFGPSMLKYFSEHDIQTEVAISELMEDAALFGSARLFDKSFWDQVKDHLPTL
ncbi:MAG: ROK family protein [Bacteroidota bacterium]